MRQGFHVGGVDREHRVEQMREANALRFRHQAEQRAVAVEAPGAALFGDFQTRFFFAKHQLVGDLARGCLIRQLDCGGADPLHMDDGNERVRNDAADRSAGEELFQCCHPLARVGVRGSLILSPGQYRRPSGAADGKPDARRGHCRERASLGDAADRSRNRRAAGHLPSFGKSQVLEYQEGRVGAGDGNRTHASSLGSCSSAIELHPRTSGLRQARGPARGGMILQHFAR